MSICLHISKKIQSNLKASLTMEANSLQLVNAGKDLELKDSFQRARGRIAQRSESTSHVSEHISASRRVLLPTLHRL